MILSDWDNVKHFNQNEAWGDWTKLDENIIFTLDEMREYSGCPIVIHCAYESGGHTTNSQHYLGKAVDMHIVGISLIEQYLLAERFNWTGIGVYPDWYTPGLHLDKRILIHGSKRSKRWARRIIDGEKKYVKLDSELIKYIIDKGI